MSLCVYMATHKKQDNYNKDFIKPIQVGASLTDVDLYQLKDNIGENISDKNKVFCELTALYWIWKNSNDDYVGLCHYRRFFDIQDKEEIIKTLESGKVIVPKLAYLGRSLERQYKHNHDSYIWDTLVSVLDEKYPEYNALSKEVFKSNKMYPFNMLIAKKEVFDGYCEWLFDVLFEVEKRVDIDKLDEYQARYAGFLSERMFMIYLLKNKLSLNEANVISDKNEKVSKSKFIILRNNAYFALHKIKHK